MVRLFDCSSRQAIASSNVHTFDIGRQCQHLLKTRRKKKEFYIKPNAIARQKIRETKVCFLEKKITDSTLLFKLTLCGIVGYFSRDGACGLLFTIYIMHHKSILLSSSLLTCLPKMYNMKCTSSKFSDEDFSTDFANLQNLHLNNN